MNKEAIELLENFRARGRYAGNIEKVDQVLVLLKEQPPVNEFIKECRELRKSRGATHEQWEYAEKMMEACKIIDQQVAQLKAKDELLFAFEYVRAPKNKEGDSRRKERKLWKSK